MRRCDLSLITSSHVLSKEGCSRGQIERRIRSWEPRFDPDMHLVLNVMLVNHMFHKMMWEKFKRLSPGVERGETSESGGLELIW